jgi:hypothetical protein
VRAIATSSCGWQKRAKARESARLRRGAEVRSVFSARRRTPAPRRSKGLAVGGPLDAWARGADANRRSGHEPIRGGLSGPIASGRKREKLCIQIAVVCYLDHHCAIAASSRSSAHWLSGPQPLGRLFLFDCRHFHLLGRGGGLASLANLTYSKSLSENIMRDCIVFAA